MKIAMIGQKGIPSRAGGIEIHAEEIIKRIQNKDIEIFVYCRKGYCNNLDLNISNNNIKIKFTPFVNTKHLDAITHTFSSTISALASGCNIFHYHALGPSTLSFIPRIFGKKVVCTVHGLDWQRSKWGGLATKYLKFGEYATARFSNKTINVSKNLVDYYRRKYGVETVYIPNGVEKPEKLEADEIYKLYGLMRNTYILFLARLVPEKGVHYLIEAYKKLNTKKKLVIAGGSSHTSEYEKQLHKMVGNDKKIIFTGFVEGNVFRELFSNAYIYVLPSDVEGLPISLLEAMSFGNCCLVSDIPENKSVIKEYGFTFKKSDITDLHKRLNLLLFDETKINSIKETVSQYILKEYNWDVVSNQTVEVYKTLDRRKK